VKGLSRDPGRIGDPVLVWRQFNRRRARYERRHTSARYATGAFRIDVEPLDLLRAIAKRPSGNAQRQSLLTQSELGQALQKRKNSVYFLTPISPLKAAERHEFLLTQIPSTGSFAEVR
jgi:hypothetical protein